MLVPTTFGFVAGAVYFVAIGLKYRPHHRSAGQRGGRADGLDLSQHAETAHDLA
jgi:hypothetical protein